MSRGSVMFMRTTTRVGVSACCPRVGSSISSTFPPLSRFLLVFLLLVDYGNGYGAVCVWARGVRCAYQSAGPQHSWPAVATGYSSCGGRGGAGPEPTGVASAKSEAWERGSKPRGFGGGFGGFWEVATAREDGWSAGPLFARCRYTFDDMC